jgi:hypothetical protein
MIERLTGKDAVSANQLSKETGVRQQNLSRWLWQARNLPPMESDKQTACEWTVGHKYGVRVKTELKSTQPMIFNKYR